MHYKPEIQAIFHLLNENSGLPFVHTGYDIPHLIRLAKKHRIVYKLYQFAQDNKSIFNEEQLSDINRHCVLTAQRSLNQLNELKKISVVLKNSGIGYICIKGPQLAHLIYGKDAIKESSDLDIFLTNSHDLERVIELLHLLEYHYSNIYAYSGKLKRKLLLIAKRELHFRNRKVRCSVDLHIRPGANTYLTARHFHGFLDHSTCYDLEGTPLNVLTDEAYFVYLCYHGSLHQYSRLSWLSDVRAFLYLKKDALDSNHIIMIARKLRIERSIYLTFQLLKELFEDNWLEVLRIVPPTNVKRIQYLVSSCLNLLNKEDHLSYKERMLKFFYIMVFLQGLPAKLDWIYGIFMRRLIKLLRARSQPVI